MPTPRPRIAQPSAACDSGMTPDRAMPAPAPRDAVDGGATNPGDVHFRRTSSEEAVDWRKWGSMENGKMGVPAASRTAWFCRFTRCMRSRVIVEDRAASHQDQRSVDHHEQVYHHHTGMHGRFDQHRVNHQTKPCIAEFVEGFARVRPCQSIVDERKNL